MGREKVSPRLISRNDSTLTMIMIMLVGRMVTIVRLIISSTVLTIY